MDKQTLASQRAYFDKVHGVTLHAIRVLDEADLDFRPKPEMRTARELMFHVYGVEKELSRAAKEGELTAEAAASYVPESEAGAATLRTLETVDDVVEYAETCHRYADAVAETITDEDLAKMVDAPFGAFTGAQFFSFINDEHWHHRGQFYAYLRLLGKEPPMLYEFMLNESQP